MTLRLGAIPLNWATANGLRAIANSRTRVVGLLAVPITRQCSRIEGHRTCRQQAHACRSTFGVCESLTTWHPHIVRTTTTTLNRPHCVRFCCAFAEHCCKCRVVSACCFSTSTCLACGTFWYACGLNLLAGGSAQRGGMWEQIDAFRGCYYVFGYFLCLSFDLMRTLANQRSHNCVEVKSLRAQQRARLSLRLAEHVLRSTVVVVLCTCVFCSHMFACPSHMFHLPSSASSCSRDLQGIRVYLCVFSTYTVRILSHFFQSSHFSSALRLVSFGIASFPSQLSYLLSTFSLSHIVAPIPTWFPLQFYTRFSPGKRAQLDAVRTVLLDIASETHNTYSSCHFELIRCADL